MLYREVAGKEKTGEEDGKNQQDAWMERQVRERDAERQHQDHTLKYSSLSFVSILSKRDRFINLSSSFLLYKMEIISLLRSEG